MLYQLVKILYSDCSIYACGGGRDQSVNRGMFWLSGRSKGS